MRLVCSRRPLVVCAVVCTFAPPAWAATINAALQDASGKPVPGVALVLLDVAGRTVARQSTDARGGALFANVPAGSYVVRSEAPAASERSVEVAADATTSLTLVAQSSAAALNVEVTATRLREARIALSPKIGTTVYTLDQQLIAEYGTGANTPMNEVLLRFPGVAQDSKASGSLHVRDEHANVQYRINGIQLPEGITGFGQSVDSRFVDKIDFVTGALPAQYGLRTAGVIDIETKDGALLKPGGSVGLLAGGHEEWQPSAEVLGSKGPWSYYATASYDTNNLGIENPQPTREALHDRTHQTRAFGYLSYIVDDNTKVGLMVGSYQGRFEIPNNPDQAPAFSLAGVSDVATGFNAVPSASLDQRQKEVNQYVVASLQQSRGELDYQVAAFYQYSSLHYMPDPAGGDLVYNGVASDVLRKNSAIGLQLDASYRLVADHTLRFGGALTSQLTHSDNSVAVFATDDAGEPLGNTPTTIVDDTAKRGTLGSLYVQDEWRIDPRFTLNYGLRVDHVSAFTHEGQASPRINALWRVTDATALHAGYSRYFTPPPQELVAQSSIDLFANTTNAPEVLVSDNVKAERTNYYDVGISHDLAPGWTVGVDAYYKDVKNLIDEGQFGQALILTPFNYRKGYAEGVEFSTTYTRGPWSGYLNFAVARAKGKDIISSQSLFAPDELAYIADHYIYLDHDQRYSASGGLTYRLGQADRLSGDAIFGSGLRNTPDGAPPNSGKLPSYEVFNVAYVHAWPKLQWGTVEGRVGIRNLFDKTYLLRDGSGVGVGAPQYGERRTWFAALSYAF